MSTVLRHLAAAALLTGAIACQGATPPVEGRPTPPVTNTPPSSAPPNGGPAATSSGPIELRVDKPEYRAGERVAMTFVNRGDAQYAFNPCFRAVEQDGGGTWVPFDEPGRICTMEAWLVDPGQTRMADTTLPRELAPGRYRITVGMSRQAAQPTDRAAAASAPFRVVSQP